MADTQDETLPDGVFRGQDGMPYLGFSYDVGAFGVEPRTPAPHGAVKDDMAPSVERLVRQTQKMLSVGVDPAKIGPPEEALDPEQATAYHEDKRYRRDLVAADGGEVSVWDGIEESEANDPDVQAWIIAYEARQRSERALTALLVYEGSWEVRAAYWLYEARQEVKMAVRRFWAWLTKVEVRP